MLHSHSPKLSPAILPLGSAKRVVDSSISIHALPLKLDTTSCNKVEANDDMIAPLFSPFPVMAMKVDESKSVKSFRLSEGTRGTPGSIFVDFTMHAGIEKNAGRDFASPTTKDANYGLQVPQNSMDERKNESRLIGNGKFVMDRKIGSGAFGEVFIGSKISTRESVAIKRESRMAKYPQLAHEFKVYMLVGGKTGFPNVHWYGTEGEYNLLVLDLLGPNLEDLFTHCGGRFSLKTSLLIADQMIARIETFHTCDMMHSDIKPENFLFGRHSRNSQNIVHLIDFGLARRYRDHITREHIICRENRPLVGTARYVSLNTHMGIETSRRDDLESIGFVLIYLILGRLPWQGLKLSNPRMDKNYKIKAKKANTTMEMLCRDLPEAFFHYMRDCRNLQFDEKPNYSQLRRHFRESFIDSGFESDDIYDWTKTYYIEGSAVPRNLVVQPKIMNPSNMNAASNRSKALRSNAFFTFAPLVVANTNMEPVDQKSKLQPNSDPENRAVADHSFKKPPNEALHSNAAMQFFSNEVSKMGREAGQARSRSQFLSPRNRLSSDADLFPIDETQAAPDTLIAKALSLPFRVPPPVKKSNRELPQKIDNSLLTANSSSLPEFSSLNPSVRVESKLLALRSSTHFPENSISDATSRLSFGVSAIDTALVSNSAFPRKNPFSTLHDDLLEASTPKGFKKEPALSNHQHRGSIDRIPRMDFNTWNRKNSMASVSTKHASTPIKHQDFSGKELATDSNVEFFKIQSAKVQASAYCEAMKTATNADSIKFVSSNLPISNERNRKASIGSSSNGKNSKLPGSMHLAKVSTEPFLVYPQQNEICESTAPRAGEISLKTRVASVINSFPPADVEPKDGDFSPLALNDRSRVPSLCQTTPFLQRGSVTSQLLVPLTSQNIDDRKVARSVMVLLKESLEQVSSNLDNSNNVAPIASFDMQPTTLPDAKFSFQFDF